MSSSPALAGFYPSKEHRTSVPLAHQQKVYDWGQAHDMRENHDGLERKDRSPPKEPTSGRRSTASRLPYAPSPLVMSNTNNTDYMKTNPKSAAPLEPPFVRDSSEDFTAGLRRAGNRWSFNGSEKTIDSKLGGWDLVEEIGKLSIANGPGTGTGGTTTPSKTNVLQIHEASPLETSSSETSLDSNSPSNGDSLTLPSHSRDSSTDTMNSESSAPSNVHLKSLKAVPFASDLTKDRPRSFSGALTDNDLRRLQNIPTPPQMPDYLQEHTDARDANGVDSKAPSSVPSGENLSGPVQPMYPSLATYPNAQQQQQHQSQQPQGPYMVHQPQNHHMVKRQEESEHPMPRQQFPNGNPSLGAPFVPVQVGTPGRQPDNMPFRQQQMRAMGMFQPSMQMQGQPPLIPSPTNFAYPAVPGTPGHNNALSLGTPQQMYNLMMPMDPAVNRTQQTFRAGHHHSASDPASIREAAASMLLNGGIPGMQNMQFSGAPGLSPGMSPGMYPAMAMTPPLYPNQFFPNAGLQGPEMFGQQQQDMMNAMARVAMPQYTGSSGTPMTPQAGQASFAGSPSPPNSTGPSANNRKLGLYKTELCRSWEEKGSCRYGPKCQFAHGEDEIRKVARHPKYKTEICRTFWVSGSCPYGKRCCFIHTELPSSGTPPGADGVPPPPPPSDGRARSMSTNSDPNESQTSLLARITARRKQEDGTGNATPTAPSTVDSPSNYQYSQKPPTGALRVDTNVEAPTASKQNKSAYPTFANTSTQVLSPGPVTAGPEFGRMLGSSGVADANHRTNGGNNANPRHSYTSSEASISYGQQPRSVSGGSSPFGMLSGQTENPTSNHGHSRSGSAGNWGNYATKNNHLSSAGTPYTHTPSPGNDAIANAQQVVSPWVTGDSGSGARHGERAWA